jgi:hypothetical protein
LCQNKIRKNISFNLLVLSADNHKHDDLAEFANVDNCCQIIIPR